MAVEIRYSGETVIVKSLRGTVEARSTSYTVGVTSGIISGGIPFSGEYEVTPTTGEQVLPTRAKTMRSDLTVHKIPFNEASNDSGGLTVSIAS